MIKSTSHESNSGQLPRARPQSCTVRGNINTVCASRNNSAPVLGKFRAQMRGNRLPILGGVPGAHQGDTAVMMVRQHPQLTAFPLAPQAIRGRRPQIVKRTRVVIVFRDRQPRTARKRQFVFTHRAQSTPSPTFAAGRERFLKLFAGCFVFSRAVPG